MRSRAVGEEPAPTQPATVTGTGVLTSPLPHSTHPLPQNRYQDPHTTHSPPYQGPPQPIAVPGSSRSSPAVLPPSGTSSPQHPLPTVPGPLPPPVTGPKLLTPSTPITPLRTPTIRLPQAEQRDQHQQSNFRTEPHGSLPLGSARRLTVLRQPPPFINSVGRGQSRRGTAERHQSLSREGVERLCAPGASAHCAQRCFRFRFERRAPPGACPACTSGGRVSKV